MGPFVVASLAIIGTFGSSSLLIYMFFATRHKQRIALLEHGQEAKVFNSIRQQKDALKFGMLSIGVGIGVLAGYFLEDAAGMDEAPAYFSMTFIIGGAALIAFYLMDRKSAIEEQS